MLCFGWPPDAGPPPETPYATVYQETQGWWVQGATNLSAPADHFAFTSAHVHLGIAYPTGEMIQKIDGAYRFPFVARLHEFEGGRGNFVRGGNFQLGGTIPQFPAPDFMRDPAGPDVFFTGTLVSPKSPANGKHENRFTFDTTSPFGKRMYQSGAWLTFVNQAPVPVSATARGWYASTGYTNVTLKTAFRASTLAATGLPAKLTYSVAQGAKWAFAYLDADIHHGSKGTILFENRTSAGAFELPGLEPGAHVLLLGAWEKAGDGWNAGVLRLPFTVA
jgi:hypothetical protein